MTTAFAPEAAITVTAAQQQQQQFDPEHVHTIAIFRALQLGDMICAIPTMRAIRQRYPHAHVSLIGLPWQQALLPRFSAYINEVIPFPGWPGLPEQPVQPAKAVEFLYAMQQRAFDVVVQMQGCGLVTNTLCMLFGARHVVGLSRRDDDLDSQWFPVIQDDAHEITRFFPLCHVLQAQDVNPLLEFPLLPDEEAAAKYILQQAGLQEHHYVVMHPGARDVRRRWAPEYFAVVGDALMDAGYTVLLTGGQEERDVLEQVACQMKHRPDDLVRLAGHTAVGVLAAIIAQARGIICNDTGAAHLAAAHDVPAIVVFSQFSDPARWAPLDRQRHQVVRSDAVTPAEVAQVSLQHFADVHR